MGTIVLDKYGIEVKRFWGGDRRGVCYGIITSSNYTELTEMEFRNFVNRLIHVTSEIK